MCELEADELLLEIFRCYGCAWDIQSGRHCWPQMTSCIAFMSHTLRDIRTRPFELVTLTRATGVVPTEDEIVSEESVKKQSEKEMWSHAWQSKQENRSDPKVAGSAITDKRVITVSFYCLAKMSYDRRGGRRRYRGEKMKLCHIPPAGTHPQMTMMTAVANSTRHQRRKSEQLSSNLEKWSVSAFLSSTMGFILC